MDKIREVPRRSKATKIKTTKHKAAKVQLTPEQQARLAAFDAVVKMRDEQWAAMTPEEQAEEIAGWERVKATINADRAGYRQVFVDE
jgi:hypothetical protein